MSNLQFQGEVFRDRREQRGLSLADAQARTHVPMEYLRAIEEGRLHELPVHTYAVGFLNSYCRFLDLDPEPFVDRFHSEPAHTGGAVRNAVPVQFKKRPWWLADLVTWGTICALLLLGWVTYATIMRPITQQGETRVEAGTRGIPAQELEEPF